MDFPNFFAQLIQGIQKIDDIIAAGDKAISDLRAANSPYLPDLEPAWLERRAQLIAARDNPDNAARVATAIGQAWSLVLGAVAPIGKPHAHGG